MGLRRQAGERVRFQLVNAGASTFFRVMVDGHPVTVVHADGSRSSRAARAVRDHDLDAFRERPDPVSPVAGPKPGLTVPWPE